MSPLDRFRYIRNLRMPGVPKCVLFILASHADASGLCWLSRPTLAAESGFGQRAIYNALQWLQAHGLVIQRHRTGRSSTFNVTLEQFKLASQTPAPRAAPPRHVVPTEVAPVKVRTRSHKPFFSHCVHCGASLKVSEPNHQGLCPRCWQDRTTAVPADVIALFPPTRRSPKPR